MTCKFCQKVRNLMKSVFLQPIEPEKKLKTNRPMTDVKKYVNNKPVK